VEKVDLNYGYWNPQRKLGVANTFSEIISLESPRKLLTLAFFRKKKTGKDISSQIFQEFAFTCRKLNKLIKILNYMVNGNIKTTFGMFLITKSSQQRF